MFSIGTKFVVAITSKCEERREMIIILGDWLMTIKEELDVLSGVWDCRMKAFMGL